jgi:hypothetical protein
VRWGLFFEQFLYLPIFSGNNIWKKTEIYLPCSTLYGVPHAILQDFYTILYQNLIIFLTSDHDFGQLYKQWEEDDEPIPVDELPDWDPRKPKAFINPTEFKSPQDYIKASKRGQTAILFVKVN